MQRIEHSNRGARLAYFVEEVVLFGELLAAGKAFVDFGPVSCEDSSPARYACKPRLKTNELFGMVGAGRFERPTPCAQGRCATRLRYAPTFTTLILS